MQLVSLVGEPTSEDPLTQRLVDLRNFLGTPLDTSLTGFIVQVNDFLGDTEDAFGEIKQVYETLGDIDLLGENASTIPEYVMLLSEILGESSSDETMTETVQRL